MLTPHTATTLQYTATYSNTATILLQLQGMLPPHTATTLQHTATTLQQHFNNTSTTAGDTPAAARES